jgi:hypothetical protein
MGDGVIRFKSNAIVTFLLDRAKQVNMADMNMLAIMDFTPEDRQQFAQLIGYSLSGYGELPYVDDAAWTEAEEAAESLRQPPPKNKGVSPKAS